MAHIFPVYSLQHTEDSEGRLYIKGTTHRIGRVLRNHRITTVYKTYQTIGAKLKNKKGKIKLENQDVYI